MVALVAWPLLVQVKIDVDRLPVLGNRGVDMKFWIAGPAQKPVECELLTTFVRSVSAFAHRSVKRLA